MRSLVALVPAALVACAVPSASPDRPAAAPVSRPVAGADASAPFIARLAELRAQEQTRIHAAWRCASQGKCSDAPTLHAVDDARDLLHAPVRGAEARALRALVARAVIDAEVQPAFAARAAERRTLTFSADGAVFALDDAPAVIAQAPRVRRAALLQAADTAQRRSLAWDAEVRPKLEEAAAVLGTDRASLLALRAGIDAATAARLARDALAATESLIGAVASDVTLLPDVMRAASGAPPPRDLPASVDDPVLADALLLARAWRRPRDPDEARAEVRRLVVHLRTCAWAALGSLEAADAAALDALASRILAADAEPVAGASLYLPRTEDGRAIERFAAALRTPWVVQALWSGRSEDEVVAMWRAAPPLEEQGFPEAFVEVVKVLPELAR
jgi:hypothetical protein